LDKGIRSLRRGVVASAAATAVSTAVVSVAAALAAVLLAREFGRTAETDGFLAAYAVYLLVVLAAQALRPVVIPDLTRAAAEGRLSAETYAYGAAVLSLALPAAALCILFADPLAEAITGGLPSEAARSCSRAVVWLVPTGCAHLLAALAASALAARDSYVTAAVGYAAGAIAGLGLFMALMDEHGLISLAWGLALNAAIAVAVPLAELARRGVLSVPARLARLGSRIAAVGTGVALPLALQGLYVVALRLAAGEGVGQVTSFSYAYLIASVMVAATASSLGLVSSAPLTRRRLEPTQAAAHVVHSSWLSVAVVAAGAGVFALAGGTIVEAVLGDAFSGDAGSDLGELLAYLAPWMVFSVALTLTFPLLFVVDRRRVVVPLALGLPIVQIGAGLALRDLMGIRGIALALALTTLVGLAAVMAAISPRMLTAAAAGLARLSVLQAGAAAITFGALSLVLGGVPAAAAGLAAYAAVLALLRPRGLRDAWSYVRALH
jgi:hypothetical protein